MSKEKKLHCNVLPSLPPPPASLIETNRHREIEFTNVRTYSKALAVRGRRREFFVVIRTEGEKKVTEQSFFCATDTACQPEATGKEGERTPFLHEGMKDATCVCRSVVTLRSGFAESDEESKHTTHIYPPPFPASAHKRQGLSLAVCMAKKGGTKGIIPQLSSASILRAGGRGKTLSIPPHPSPGGERMDQCDHTRPGEKRASENMSRRKELLLILLLPFPAVLQPAHAGGVSGGEGHLGIACFWSRD